MAIYQNLSSTLAEINGRNKYTRTNWDIHVSSQIKGGEVPRDLSRLQVVEPLLGQTSQTLA